MSLSIELLDSVSSIEGKINAAMAEEINKTLSRNLSKITQDIQALIPKWINQQPEINAILSRELVGAFGTLLSPQSIVNAIIDSVSSSMSVSLKRYNNKLSGGGLDINIQPDNFANLLGLSEGHTIYSGGDLHWLEWMLLRGDEIIVVGYEYNPKSGIGRTRLGNMVSGRGFRVPPQYSGTIDNNFITRALIGQTQSNDITKIIKDILG